MSLPVVDADIDGGAQTPTVLTAPSELLVYRFGLLLKVELPAEYKRLQAEGWRYEKPIWTGYWFDGLDEIVRLGRGHAVPVDGMSQEV